MPVLKNPRHELFAQQYMKSRNGRKSYIAAGYSPQGADASASALLKNPKVSARISELSTKVSEGVVKVEISERSNRVAALQDRWLRMRQLIEERAAHTSTTKAPGGKTGLLCVTYKAVNGKKVTEYQFDAALLRELRAHEEQVARELGQWVEKQAQTDSKGKDLPNKLVDISTENLLAALALLTPKVPNS